MKAKRRRARPVRWVLGTALCVAVIPGMLIVRKHEAPAERADVGDTTPAAAEADPDPAAVSVHPAEDLDAKEIKRITELLAADHAFGRDVVFLVAATVRERCIPNHAGELARMAGRARLPVLAGTAEVTEREPDLDRAIYVFVRQIGDEAPCDKSLDLGSLGLSLVLDPEAYAAAFPDSFYRPSLRSIPREYAGWPLAQRSRQGCQSIGYVVIPSGEPDWRCTALWSGARRRIVELCEEERAREVEVPGSGDVPDALASRLTDPVAAIVAGLPGQCRLD